MNNIVSHKFEIYKDEYHETLVKNLCNIIYFREL